MRQRRWLELLKDYDCEILYHLGKANVVADALSSHGASVASMMAHEWLLLEHMSELTISVVSDSSMLYCAALSVHFDLVDQIQDRQRYDVELDGLMVDMERFGPIGYSQREDGLLLFQGRICVPNDKEIRQRILEEAH